MDIIIFFFAVLIFFAIFCWMVSKDQKAKRDLDLQKEHETAFKRLGVFFGLLCLGFTCYFLWAGVASEWEAFSAFGTIFIFGLISLISFIVSYSGSEEKSIS